VLNQRCLRTEESPPTLEKATVGRQMEKSMAMGKKDDEFIHVTRPYIGMKMAKLCGDAGELTQRLYCMGPVKSESWLVQVLNAR